MIKGLRGFCRQVKTDQHLPIFLSVLQLRASVPHWNNLQSHRHVIIRSIHISFYLLDEHRITLFDPLGRLVVQKNSLFIFSSHNDSPDFRCKDGVSSFVVVKWA